MYRITESYCDGAATAACDIPTLDEAKQLADALAYDSHEMAALKCSHVLLSTYTIRHPRSKRILYRVNASDWD
jgi:hypothetical protein